MNNVHFLAFFYNTVNHVWRYYYTLLITQTISRNRNEMIHSLLLKQAMDSSAKVNHDNFKQNIVNFSPMD